MEHNADRKKEMINKFFRNRFCKEHTTKIISAVSPTDISRCRMMSTLEEIPYREAARIVQAIGHLPHVELYGIALEGCEHNDRRRASGSLNTVVIKRK